MHGRAATMLEEFCASIAIAERRNFFFNFSWYFQIFLVVANFCMRSKRNFSNTALWIFKRTIEIWSEKMISRGEKGKKSLWIVCALLRLIKILINIMTLIKASSDILMELNSIQLMHDWYQFNLHNSLSVWMYLCLVKALEIIHFISSW